ncbi:L,D-transpeptidase [Achromobacter mucicolens]|uniref:L,D-transpeptidase n=1 Tax=Achromobacter mucicolens TaxID=1389922 RepID=A0ABD4YWA6_9BURK|nr:L,D-transpeptidase [Achromobacter mucicolens]MDH1179580.1 L,D-transpeptidase [Achromobacter mucicolens]
MKNKPSSVGGSGHGPATARAAVWCAVLSAMMTSPVPAQFTPQDVMQTFALRVAPALTVPADEQIRYASLALGMLKEAGLGLLGPQYALVVDRNPKVQAVFLFWLPAIGMPVHVGAAPVSTGRIGQFDHFETPTGVYPHTLANPDFRAQGTKNANGILGYGAKGMRVYDFGWQQALRGWGNGGVSTMRLQMHATDPVLLESKLGTPQSKGCIRIPATLNRLLDSYGLLDADYELAADLVAPPWVLQPGRTPANGAGRYLIIVDTERESRPDWAVPARAAAH